MILTKEDEFKYLCAFFTAGGLYHIADKFNDLSENISEKSQEDSCWYKHHELDLNRTFYGILAELKKLTEQVEDKYLQVEKRPA